MDSKNDWKKKHQEWLAKMPAEKRKLYAEAEAIYEKSRPERTQKELESFWPAFINWMALVNDLGPGPKSTMSPDAFTDKIRKIAFEVEDVFQEMVAGRSDLNARIVK